MLGHVNLVLAGVLFLSVVTISQGKETSGKLALRLRQYATLCMFLVLAVP